MLHLTRRALTPLALLFALAFTALPVHAQIDLPRRSDAGDKDSGRAGDKRQDPKAGEPKRNETRGRGLAPHMLCAICGERNYTAARDRPTEGGFFTAFCGLCRQDRIHRPSESRSGLDGLDLPRGGSAPSAPAETATVGEGPRAQPTAPVQGRPGDRQAAAAIYREVGEITNLSAPFLHQAVDSLLAMGEEGLNASRIALRDEAPARVLTAARVLLRGGGDDGGLRVVERLHDKLPVRLGPRLLVELMRSDPVHGSPELLVELLQHSQQRMRAAARQELQKQLGPELLPLLAQALTSKRAETRLVAAQLITGIDDPGVFDILAPYLDDPAAHVASQVVTSIASLDDPRVPLELEARAFSGRWMLRTNAFALLAIIEREDLTLEPILDDRHAEHLLVALEMTDPLVYGACAAALAGIGFRSETPEATAWLDREVTGRLVSIVSGRHFHADYSALQPRALRRLELITGRNFAGDGPAWARWWIDSRDTFYARRVSISVAGPRVRQLELHYRSAAQDPGVFTLFGPDCDQVGVVARSGGGELFHLTEQECIDLSAVLTQAEVLGPQRMPGLRGEPSTRTRKIEVLVDGRGKGFSFSSRSAEPWFEAISSAMRDVRDRNRWQRFPDLALHSSARTFWQAEAPWWAEEHGELERALRMKELVFKAATGFSPSARNVVVEELERLYEVPGVASLDDFRPLLSLLRDEGFYGDRTRRLLYLAFLSASVERGAGDERLPVDLARTLLDLVNARFGLESAEDMTTIARAAGRPFLRGLVREQRPLLRAIAASGIGEELAAARETSLAEDPEGLEQDSEGLRADRAALLGLLEDPEPFVEAAACLALGRAKIEEARTDLLVRARLADPAVRAAALRAVARLGGDYVLEALVLGASAPDQAVRRAAAEGLAELEDPRTAPMLVSLIGLGRDEPVFEPARNGLLALGEAAWAELARVANSPVHRARREALLILAYQAVPRSAGGLIELLGDDPSDGLVAEELAVLTCVDHRDHLDPVEAWSAWWEQVVHDDAQAWLRAAMERLNVSAPGPDALRGNGTREGALFLLQVIERPEPHLAERGRRGLERILGHRLTAPAAGTSEHAAWLSGLRKLVGQRWDS